uniref:Uncharacterized protein n=1 Tax=Romanomermis culicivorax TaxID=13658 RepID=A0A915KIN7_ROMCU
DITILRATVTSSSLTIAHISKEAKDDEDKPFKILIFMEKQPRNMSRMRSPTTLTTCSNVAEIFKLREAVQCHSRSKNN